MSPGDPRKWIVANISHKEASQNSVERPLSLPEFLFSEILTPNLISGGNMKEGTMETDMNMTIQEAETQDPEPTWHKMDYGVLVLCTPKSFREVWCIPPKMTK
jgi:hypothetical protein